MTLSMKLYSLGLLLAAILPNVGQCAERPTLNITCDPRPDILTHPLYYAHKEYRRQYNRPRNIAGWLVHRISPTSQEAMVWLENKRVGNYEERNMPPRYKRYFSPKPWEVLQTGARPDFAKPANGDVSSQYSADSQAAEPRNLAEPNDTYDPEASSRSGSTSGAPEEPSPSDVD